MAPDPLPGGDQRVAGEVSGGIGGSSGEELGGNSLHRGGDGAFLVPKGGTGAGRHGGHSIGGFHPGFTVGGGGAGGYRSIGGFPPRGGSGEGGLPRRAGSGEGGAPRPGGCGDGSSPVAGTGLFSRHQELRADGDWMEDAHGSAYGVETMECQVKRKSTSSKHQFGCSSLQVDHNASTAKRKRTTDEEETKTAAKYLKSGYKEMSPSVPKSQIKVLPVQRKLELDVGTSTSRDDLGTPYSEQFHELFICSHDRSSTLGNLAYYAGNHRNLDRGIPVGDSTYEEFVSPRDETRFVLRKSVRVLEKLHKEGWTLNGNFDFSNFEVHKNRRVQLNNISPGSLQRLRRSGSDADYSEFALQAWKHFFSAEIPSEMKQWFTLLLEDSTDQEYLVVNSIALMEAKKAIFHFGYLYGQLLLLKDDRHSEYQKIIKYLNKRHRGWIKKARTNSFTKAILQYFDSEEEKYKDNAQDLLRLCRNLAAHAFDKSLRKNLELTYRDILRIINSLFPGLLSDLERIMHQTLNLQALIQSQ